MKKRDKKILIAAIVVIAIIVAIILLTKQNILFSPSTDAWCYRSDVNMGGTVSSTDMAVVKLKVGCEGADKMGLVNTPWCARADVNMGGTVSSTDMAVVKSRIGCVIPEDVTCYDSDTGSVDSMRGWVSIYSSTAFLQVFADFCASPNILIEGTCVADKPAYNVTGIYCPNGCSDGACNRFSCTYDCSSVGQRRCVNSNTGYQICGTYDSDPCLEYSSTIPCSTGYVCVDGYCVLQYPTNTTNSTNPITNTTNSTNSTNSTG